LASGFEKPDLKEHSAFGMGSIDHTKKDVGSGMCIHLLFAGRSILTSFPPLEDEYSPLPRSRRERELAKKRFL
jgi:hypothetical protein